MSTINKKHKKAMNFYDKTNLILRLDQMIRLRFRGNADSLSRRLGVSRSTFFRLLDDMKSLDAPIEYDETGQFYYYDKVGRFRFGFYKNSAKFQQRQITGFNR